MHRAAIAAAICLAALGLAGDPIADQPVRQRPAVLAGSVRGAEPSRISVQATIGFNKLSTKVPTAAPGSSPSP